MAGSAGRPGGEGGSGASGSGRGHRQTGERDPLDADTVDGDEAGEERQRAPRDVEPGHGEIGAIGIAHDERGKAQVEVPVDGEALKRNSAGFVRGDPFDQAGDIAAPGVGLQHGERADGQHRGEDREPCHHAQRHAQQSGCQSDR
jgi:hypothetical protein